MSAYKLSENIVALSQNGNWDLAKLEWSLREVYEDEEKETCLCGHYPIVEVCVLANKYNGNSAIVGNCCVKKFIGLPSDKIFQAVKRVRKDNEKSLNAEALQHAFDKGWINQWELNFSVNTMRKRSLSGKQLAKRIQINEKMLENMKRRRNQ